MSDEYSDPLATTVNRQLMIAKKYTQQESTIKINSINLFLSIQRLTHNEPSHTQRESERIFTHCVRVARALSCCPSLSLTFARWLNGRRCLISTYTQSFVEFSIEFIVYLAKRVRSPALSLVLSGSVGLCVQCNAFAIAIAITVANVVALHLAVCSVLLNFAMLLLVVRF